MKEVRIAYTIRQGDNLLKIAECFETTVEKILLDNKHININKYKVGEILSVVPGSIHKSNSLQMNNDMTMQECYLNKEMRKVWQEHIFWTRSAIVSILENMDDIQAVSSRLMQNPMDIAMVFKPYYSSEVMREIERLIKEHLTIAANLLMALNKNDKMEFRKYNEEFYNNANEIAKTLSTINPNYNEEELRKALYKHLDLLKETAYARHSDNYAKDIEYTDMSHEQIIKLADYLAKGLVAQFPDMF